MKARNFRSEAKQAFVKKVRALDLERCELWRKIDGAEVVPLDEPYQRGWVRFFEWSESVTRRPDFEAFEGLLELFQSREWSRHPDFRLPRWLRDRRVPVWAPRLAFPPRELLRRCRDRRWPKYFEINRYREVEGVDHLRELVRRGWGGTVRFRSPRWLVPRVEPFFVTHRRLEMPEAEARLAEIEAWLDRCGHWRVVNRVLERRSWKGPNERRKKLDRLDDRETRAELERRGFIRAFRVTWARRRAWKVAGCWGGSARGGAVVHRLAKRSFAPRNCR